MPASSASDNLHLAKFAELLLGDFHFVEKYFAAFERHSPEQSVADGARLFVNLFQHEMFETALFRLDGVPGDVLHDTLDRMAVVVHHANAFGGEDGEVAVAQETP